MTYQDQLEDTAAATTAQVVAALVAWQAGRLTTEALIAVAAAYVAAGNSAAAALADLSLSAAVTIQTGQVAAPLGIARPLDDLGRLTRAAQTIVEDLDAAPDHEAAMVSAHMRFTRLAAAEVKEAAARSYSAAIEESHRVTGWTRGLSASACQLCRWWSRGGQVWVLLVVVTGTGLQVHPLWVGIGWSAGRHLDDPEALTTAIDELLARKPHLASRRPAGDVGRGATKAGETVDLAGMLRRLAT